MPRALQEWTVLPHGHLTQLDDNILTVTGDIHMPVGDFPRRMTVVRLADQRLVIYTAVPGSPSEEALRLLSVVGTQSMAVSSSIER